jgi:hypothetical protein
MCNSSGSWNFFFHRKFVRTPPQGLAKNFTSSKRHSDSIKKFKSYLKLLYYKTKHGQMINIAFPISSVLHADSECHTSFHSLPIFSDQNLLNIHEKVTKLRLKNSMLTHFLCGHILFNLQKTWFCSF